MDLRLMFISDYLEGLYGMSALCASYGISRKTGYKWARRYRNDGLDGLKNRSCRPHYHRAGVDDETRQAIIETKLAHQSFGPEKVMDLLRCEQSDRIWPADSTAGEILKRAGLVKSNRRRGRISPDSHPFAQCDRPNAVWSADFKGNFALGNGVRCHPLTISDNDSRYLLQCRALTRTGADYVRPRFEWCFREYGLPEAMRIDNGPPFASMSLGGIGHISKWWIKPGIKPERIEPGKPQQNGRHERMHRSLKAAVAAPPKYSKDRIPALDRKTPPQVYQPSTRRYPEKIAPVSYDEGFVVRNVKQNGEIKWQGRRIYVSQTLAKEAIGLKQIDESEWGIYFSFYQLGIYDERKQKVIPCKRWRGK